MANIPKTKVTSTPNKPLENPTWTLDEGEEMHKDIYYLQKKSVTKDELQRMMDSTEAKIEAIMDTKYGWIKRGDHGRVEKVANREAT